VSGTAEFLERFSGLRVEGGTTGVKLFTWAFGLDKAAECGRVADVAWDKDHVEVKLETGGGAGPLLVSVWQREPGKPGFAQTKNLLLSYRGDGMSGRLARLIPRAMLVRLADATLGQLLSTLTDDPDFKQVTSAKPPADSAGGPAPGPPGADGPGAPGPGEGPPKDPEAEAAYRSMKGSRRAGGAASKARVMELLGLDNVSFEIEVDAVAWMSDHVEISVVLENDRPVAFSIEWPNPESGYFVSTPHLGVTYQAKNLPEELTKVMRAHAPARLANLTIESLAALMAEDPELGDTGLKLPSSEHQHPSNQLDTWGARDSFSDFFAGGELARGQLDSVNMGKFFRNVQHCDNECLVVNPHGPIDAVPMVDLPWENRHRTAGLSAAEAEAYTSDAEDDWSEADSMVATDLNEQDVIMGNPTKLRQVLDVVIKRPNPANKPIFVANTCVPTVIGEDVESVVKEYREKTDIPLLYLTVTPTSMNNVFHDFLVARRLKAEEEVEVANQHSVNLIGFPDRKDVNEMVELLASSGISRNVLLLPDIDMPRIEGLPAAALNVFYPNQLWEHLYDQIRLDSRIPGVTPPAPYGRDGVRAWLAAIAEKLELPQDPELAWRSYSAPYEEDWQRATAKAPEHRLGFVVRGEEMQYMLDPGTTWGVPTLRFAEEAGFGVDVILHVDEASIGKKLSAQVEALFGDGHTNTVTAIQTFDEMCDALRSSDCEAVLSHHVYDWRLSSTGKSRFTLQHFEIGLPGAIRTIDRLVRICETPFYRRYQRHLARSRTGLRTAVTGGAQ
jgi:hypothetical protein